MARDWHREKESKELLPANCSVHPPEGLGAEAKIATGGEAANWRTHFRAKLSLYSLLAEQQA